MQPLRWIASILFVTAFAGCATVSMATQTTDRSNLATYALMTRDFANMVKEYVNHDFVQDGDKSTLLARSEILARHAEDQLRRAEAFKPATTKAGESELRDLQARSAGLANERDTLEREWSVWQVKHGLKKPGEVDLSYTRNEPDC